MNYKHKDSLIQIPQSLAIWDPDQLHDPAGQRCLTVLQHPDFLWQGVQIRDKAGSSDKETYNRIAAACRERNLFLCINRDPELALALAADAIVCGPTEFSDIKLPRLTSIHALEELTLADQAASPIIGHIFGNVLETPSKPGKAAAGWNALQSICAKSEKPVLAIGGMDLNKLETARAHGAWGIAAIRAAFAEKS